MELDVTKILVSITGKELSEKVKVDQEDENAKVVWETKPVLVKDIVVNALLSTNPQKVMPGTEKIQRYNLATIVYQASGLLELKEDERKLIRSSVLEGYPPVIAGQVAKMLEK